MTPNGLPLAYHRLRAPTEHGQTLFDPPLQQAADFFQSNRRRRLNSCCDFCGVPLRELSRQAQREFLELALRFTSVYQDVATPDRTRELALVLTGHQPQLYHPGVWLKNFAAAAIARQVNAWTVNLIIDSDTIRTASIRAPAGTPQSPSTKPIPFDASSDEVPFEERPVRDFATWAGFPCRIRREMEHLLKEPLVARLWPWAIAAAQQTGKLGLSLSRARHRLETEWGLDTLELPLSSLAATRTFARFTWKLLSESDRFRQVHNQALAEYRLLHRIRSPLHPVPDLVRESPWQETPFWVWRADAPLRRRLFLRRRNGRIELRDGPAGTPIVDIAHDCAPESAIDQLVACAANGWKIRPRALVTTMYARLFLCDLFVHGIGGAKYDQVTDLIIDRFLGASPPSYLTATGTLLLPIPHPVVEQEDLRVVERALRELKWVPERLLNEQTELSESVRELMAAKQSWVERQVPRQQAKERCLAIRDLSTRLQSQVQSQRDELLAEHHRLSPLAVQHALLGSREFSLALFPEKFLRPLLLELSAYAL